MEVIAKSAGRCHSGDDEWSDLPNTVAALEKQIGLKLVKAKDIALDAIVVDHVDKVPTGN